MRIDPNTLNNYNLWQAQLKSLHIRGLVLAAQGDYFVEEIALKNGSLATNSKLQDFLGCESNIIIFDASANFDANLFAAITGTLVGGGILFLILSPKVLDYAFALSSHSKASSITDSTSLEEAPLLNRIISTHIQNDSTAMLVNGQFMTSPKLQNKQAAVEIDQQFTEQNELINKIVRVSKGHANRPLVIIANRGRGKSAALGVATSRLINQSTVTPLEIIVTAPNRNNLTSFYKHLTIDQLDGHTSNFLKSKTGSSVRFMPIDEIIKNKPFASLVIIDEAAAIPVTQLIKITHFYNRIVFSTTSDGYEGNGKGFEIRFKKQLINDKPNTRFTTLNRPIRWSCDDELEASSFKALLLNSRLESISSVTQALITDITEKKEFSKHHLADKLTFEVLTKEFLTSNESCLQSVFSLLVNAHYQTRPADLQAILSNKNLTVTCLKYGDHILAVALINNEGLLCESTCRNVCNGDLRLKGELLPQSIMAHFGISEAGQLSFHRVMRIAVLPALKNYNLGSYLLAKIEEHALLLNIDILGTSFSASVEVVQFWLKNGFASIRFGSSKDSSSGSHCLEMIKTLGQKSKPIFEILVQRFESSFMYKIHGELKSLELEIISTILQQQVQFSEPVLSGYELQELFLFSQGKRGLSVIEDLLLRLVKSKMKQFNQLRHSNIINERDSLFLIDCVFMQSNLIELAQRFKLSGKKEALSHLRVLVARLLSTNALK